MKKTFRRLCLLAGLATMATSASAFSIDPQIMIDRALNSPTLTIRYTGVTATLVELRVNGESLGTRTVAATKNSGETNFTLNLADLKDGDNEVEVRLFDRSGKLVGKDRTNISTESGQNGPVFLAAPKMGATVQGAVEINVGFGETLKSSYVSFFIDGNFKSMTNFPPFVFTWDTEKETNGWHELEAWAVDDTSATHKTKKVRVFINNPGGRTNRKGVAVDTTVVPTRNPSRPADVIATDRGLRTGDAPRAGARAVTVSPQGLPPAVVDRLTSIANPVRPSTGAMAGTKPTSISAPIATGPKYLTPTGTRVAKVAAVTTVATVAPVKNVLQTTTAITAASSLLRIQRGSRMPNLASFAIVMDTQFVNFDVNPRVENGIPMTPLRHLLEKAGGTVAWQNALKRVDAKSDGKDISLQIGQEMAQIGTYHVRLERAPYLDRGRTIVPLSFIREALNVDVEYDRSTGHVLITSTAK